MYKRQLSCLLYLAFYRATILFTSTGAFAAIFSIQTFVDASILRASWCAFSSGFVFPSGSACVLDDVAPRHSLPGTAGGVPIYRGVFRLLRVSSPVEMLMLRLTGLIGNVPWYSCIFILPMLAMTKFWDSRVRCAILLCT